MKKALCVLLTAGLILSCAAVLGACGKFGRDAKPTEASATQAATAAPTQAPTVSVTEAPAAPVTEPPAPTTPPGPSPAKVALQNKLAESGAEGYTISRIIGSDDDQLILSYGVSEAEKHYDVYAIRDDGLSFEGTLSTSHTIPYIDRDTQSFACFSAHMGSFAYGPLTLEGGLRVATVGKGTIGEGEEYPEVPGTTVDFYHIDDTAPIANY